MSNPAVKKQNQKSMERVETSVVEYLILSYLAEERPAEADTPTAGEIYRQIQAPAREMQINAFILLVMACLWSLSEKGYIRRTDRGILQILQQRQRRDYRYEITGQGREYVELYASRMALMGEFFIKQS